MAGSYIAVEGYELSKTNIAPGVTTFGTPAETCTVALKAKVDGKKVLTSLISYDFSAGCEYGTCKFNSGKGSISATAIKGKCDGNPVLREGDIGNCTGTFTDNSSGAPVTVPCSCLLKIGNAGQDKVKSV